ncbi:MAG TPA: efflux transporter outer membrane subunit [Candidatus Acidoferrales bacterium]|nr:efflux transporter outer membrane subunit [Candidatus Acidoferrales bacterium]
MKLVIVGLLVAQLLATCSPPYHRPDTQEPATYRFEPASSQLVPAMGELGWWQVFRDPQLQSLLRTAVANNADILVAAQRLQQAEAQYTIVSGEQYPQINAVLSAQYQQTNGQRPVLSPRSTFAPNGLLTLQYELDFFGKIHSQVAAANAQVLQTEFARETVTAAVVSSVATLYFQLLELDEELDISRKALAARTASLSLVRARLEGGIGTLQDVRQAQELVAQTAAAIPLIQRGLGMTEDALSILLGQYPGAIGRDLPLNDQIALPDVPAVGLPSELLEQRPDVRESEEALIAADAQIGVARALLFPQVTITAAVGAGTAQANGLTLPAIALPGPGDKTIGPITFPQSNYGQGYVSILPQIVQQIFNAGAARANYAASQAGEEAAVLQYIQSVQQAFGDVSDDLLSYQKYKENDLAELANAAAAVDSARLANLRFEGGVTSYLEVLSSQTQAYGAQISLAQADLNERLALVQLYKATGGGWQPEPQRTNTPLLPMAIPHPTPPQSMPVIQPTPVMQPTQRQSP